MATPTPGDVERVINGYEAAQEATEYVNSIVFEAELIGTDRYKFVFSTQNGRTEQ